MITVAVATITLAFAGRAPFTRSTPEGVSVELVSISTKIKGKQVSWKPDGRLITPPHSWQEPNMSGFAGTHYQLAFRLKPLAGNTAVLAYKVPGASGMSHAPGQASQNGKALSEAEFTKNTSGLRILNVFMKSSHPASIKVGVAGGAYRTLTRVAPSLSGSSSSAHGSPMAGELYVSRSFKTGESEFCVVVTDSLNNADLSIRAKLRDGARIQASISQSGSKDLRQAEATFDSPLEKVAEIEILARPFHWVEFKGVRLAPTP